MHITKQLDILDALENHVTGEVFDALNASDIVEQEVVIEVENYRSGRPGMYYGLPENCYEDEPSDWDEEPAEDYGFRVLSRILERAATDERLAKAIVGWKQNTVLRDIYRAVNDTILAWDNSEDVAAEMNARADVA